MRVHKKIKQLILTGIAGLGCLFFNFAINAEEPPANAAKTGSLSPKSRLGINLAGMESANTELPFVNVFRLSRPWSSDNAEGMGKGPKLDLDEHRWVKKLEPGCKATTIFINPCLTGHYPEGDYVLLYDGEGDLTIGPGDDHKIVSQGSGRIVFKPNVQKGMVSLQITKTNSDNYIRNIRVIMPGFEETYQKDPFHPAFLDRWKDFNTFRFMNWCLGNESTSEVKEWTERAKLEDATWNTGRGVPVEIMVDLCNRVKLNAWFCMPHLCSDDYVKQFASYVKKNLDPTLKVHIEYTNEAWNGVFKQTHYVRKKGVELGFPGQPWEAGAKYFSQRSVEIFKIWEEAFGGKDRLVRVLAWQTGTGAFWLDQTILGWQEAYKNCDAVAIAPYLAFGIPDKGTQMYPLTAATVATWSVEQLLDHLEQVILPISIKAMESDKKIAEKYNLKFLAYEGGQHAVGVLGGENNEAMNKVLFAANRHPRMGEIYKKYMDAWRDIGGDTFCNFWSCAKWSKFGTWGLLEYADETEKDQPKFRALMEWNRANLRSDSPTPSPNPVKEIGSR